MLTNQTYIDRFGRSSRQFAQNNARKKQTATRERKKTREMKMKMREEYKKRTEQQQPRFVLQIEFVDWADNILSRCNVQEIYQKR